MRGLSTFTAAALALGGFGLAATAAVAAGSEQQQAAAGAAGQEGLFARVDADGDGVIGREEAMTFVEDWFARLDDDGDGALSRDEYTAGYAAAEGQTAASAEDGDVEAGLTRFMSEADRRYLETALQAGDQLPSAEGQQATAGGQVLDARFGKLDQDGDGSVTQEEYMRVAEHYFETADQDGDGEITPSEFESARAM